MLSRTLGAASVRASRGRVASREIGFALDDGNDVEKDSAPRPHLNFNNRGDREDGRENRMREPAGAKSGSVGGRCETRGQVGCGFRHGADIPLYRAADGSNPLAIIGREVV